MGLFNKNQSLPPDDREHTICNTGHRPQSLPWGFDETKSSCVAFKVDLYNTIERAINAGFTHYISGLAIGVDTMFAEAVIELRKKYKNITLEGAIPCRNQDERWNAESKKRYAKIKKECDFLTYISNEYTPTCMNDRNKYMVDHSAVVIAVWNGKPSGTGNTIHFAKERGCKIKIINPEDYRNK